MKNIVCWNVASALLLALGIVHPGLAWSQGAFPEGRGKDILLSECVLCHPPSRVTRAQSRAQLTADDWEVVLYEMIARGTPMHQTDIEVLKKYLIDNFAVKQQ
jgi:hypothetical protein